MSTRNVRFESRPWARAFSFGWLVLVAVLVAGLVSCGEPAPTKPNVVVLLADDLGWNDVGYHGGAIETPRIDRFASEALVLDRFYVSPQCTSTRAGLLTGRYPHRVGAPYFRGKTRYIVPELALGATLLGEWLAEAGYGSRALVGKWGLGGPNPLDRGFTSFYGFLGGAVGYFNHRSLRGDLDWYRDRSLSPDRGYATDLLAAESVAFIQAEHEAPFLLFVAFNAPHVPLQAKPDVLAKLGAPADLEQAPEIHTGNDAHNALLYAAMVMTLDDAIGRILDAIDKAGIRENTLVLFSSDNGAFARDALGDNSPYRAGKATVYEGGIRVPTAIRWPARLKPGVSTVLSSFIDVVPTLLQAAGQRVVPSVFDGVGLLETLTGGDAPPDRVLYLAPDAALSERWKLVGSALYDLALDPREEKDVSEREPEVVARLKQQLELQR